MAIYNNAKKEAIITLHQPNIHHRKIHNNKAVHMEGPSLAVSRIFHHPPVKAQANYQVKGWTENKNVC